MFVVNCNAIFIILVNGLKGVLIDDKTPIVCGGLLPFTANCYKVENGNWSQTYTMNAARGHFCAMAMSPYQDRFSILKIFLY